jgi:hypothetical protein
MFSLWTLPAPNIRGRRYLFFVGNINIVNFLGFGKGKLQLPKTISRVNIDYFFWKMRGFCEKSQKRGFLAKNGEFYARL